jgi:hypothetical protein
VRRARSRGSGLVGTSGMKPSVLTDVAGTLRWRCSTRAIPRTQRTVAVKVKEGGEVRAASSTLFLPRQTAPLTSHNLGTMHIYLRSPTMPR